MRIHLISNLEKIFGSKKEILEKDFRDDVEIDRDLTLKFGWKNRGSVRLGQGLFFTKDEYNKWRDDILATDTL